MARKRDPNLEKLLKLIKQGPKDYEPLLWMFNGEELTVGDFANKVWPVDCPDKTTFLLRYA